MNKGRRVARQNKSESIRIWLLMGLMLGIFCWSATLSAQQTLTMVSDPWPPYVQGELGTTADSGIAVELVTEIFNRIDKVDLQIQVIPWKRALLEVERGFYDGIPLLLKTPERENYLTYSIPMFVGKNLAWSLENKSGEYFEWQELDDFSGRRIGIIQDYSYGKSLDQRIAEGTLDVVAVPSVSHMFDMLVNGRIDIALANDAVGVRMVSKYPGVKIWSAKQPTDLDIYHLALSRKSAFVHLMPRINEIIRELQDNGFIERLIQAQEQAPP